MSYALNNLTFLTNMLKYITIAHGLKYNNLHEIYRIHIMNYVVLLLITKFVKEDLR